MSDFQDKKMMQRFEISAGLYNFKDELVSKTLKEKYKQKNNLFERYRKKQIVFPILCSFIIGISGIVLATNYKKIVKSFMMGSGIDKAIDNGYIQTVDMEYENSNVIVTNNKGECILNNSNIGIKIDDFLIDDTNLNTHFNIKLDEKIQNIINFNEITQIEINKLTIIDEQNNKVNKIGCGVNYFIEEKDINNNIINYTYNIYTNDNFPNSKNLYYEITNLTIKNNQTNIYLEGNWKISLTVPEEMIKRTSIEYEVVNCNNPDFNVYTAKATNTGFEIGLTVNNVKKLENPLENFKKELSQKYNNGEIDINELNRLYKEKEEDDDVSEQYLEYLYSRIPIKIDTDYEEQGKTIEDTSYVENSKGEKYLCTMSPGRKSNQNFISDTVLDFYETFGLTKNEATNDITVKLMYNENPVTIQLKKK